MILLNPGPVNLSDRVRRALSGPDLCHREPEFAELKAGVRRRLLVRHLGMHQPAADLPAEGQLLRGRRRLLLLEVPRQARS